MAANCKSETQKLLMKHYGNQHERPCDVTMCDPMEGGRVKEAKGSGRETEGEREGDRRGEGGKQKGRGRETEGEREGNRRGEGERHIKQTQDTETF